MRIVVTGGAGKLGLPVVAELLSPASGTAGHEVHVFDRTPLPPETGASSVVGDIENADDVSEALAGADAVIHLAGIPTHSVAPDDATFRINTMGTFNVHEAAGRHGIGRVVTASSEAVLGWAPGSWQREHIPEYLPMDEDHPRRPQDPYGLSKVACEEIARSFTEKCGMETVLLRPPWVVSPEELDGLRATRGRRPETFALFHYIDARDAAVAFRRAVERPLPGCTVLFTGSGESVVDEPLCDVYPRLMPAIGDRAKTLTGAQGPVSVARAREMLDWQPVRSWRRSGAAG